MTKRRKSNPQPDNVIRFLRCARGETLAQVQEATGVSACLVNRMEFGHFGQVGPLRRLAEHFQVPIDTLVYNDYTALACMTHTPVKASPERKEHLHSVVRIREEVGDLGEILVLKLERERLAGTGYENLVNANYADELGAGFDLLSFSDDCRQRRYIEVKSTLSNDPDEPFFMTAGELSFARHCQKNGMEYRLYRLYNLRDHSNWAYEIYTADEVLRRSITPSQYRVKKGGAA